MRLNEFASADDQLALLKIIVSNTLKTLDDQKRAEVTAAMRRKTANRGRVPTKRVQPPEPRQAVVTPPKLQNVEPETQNIEAPLRPQAS